MLTLPGERAAIDVESTNLSTELDPREPLRLVQAPPKRAKVSFLPMIGNVNWARRTTCNVCNGPQFTVEEERTGLGGGFDERGTVEYKEPMIAQSVPDPPSEPEEEEEDEEEEDDDDGDLSKYDLWGDPEEDKKKEEVKPTNGSTLKPINEKKASVLLDEKKKSRSRSRSKRRSRSRSKDSSKKRSRRSRSSRFTMFGSDCTDLILLTF